MKGKSSLLLLLRARSFVFGGCIFLSGAFLLARHERGKSDLLMAAAALLEKRSARVSGREE